MQQDLPIIVLLATIKGNNGSDDIAYGTSLYVLAFNFTNMHAMSYRSDIFLASSSTVNI